MFVNFDAWSQFVTSSLTFQPLSLKAYTNFDKDTWMIVEIFMCVEAACSAFYRTELVPMRSCSRHVCQVCLVRYAQRLAVHVTLTFFHSSMGRSSLGSTTALQLGALESRDSKQGHSEVSRGDLGRRRMTHTRVRRRSNAFVWEICYGDLGQYCNLLLN